MDEVKAAILAVLNSKNGVCTWDEMLAGLPSGGRRYVHEALRQLKDENKAQAQTRYDPIKNAVFEIVRLGG